MKFYIALLLCVCGLKGQILTPILTGTVSSGGGSYVGPNDAISGADVFFGLRAVSAAYAGGKVIRVCNVSDFACADFLTDPTTGALVVTTVGGSNCGSVTCTIKTFYDQIGTACAGPCDVTQTTIANRAIFKTTCPGITGPCAQFNSGAADPYVSNPIISGITAPFTFSWVGNRQSGTSNQGVLAVGSIIITGFGAANNVILYGGMVVSAPETDGAWQAVQGVYNTSSSVIYVNGSQTSGLNPGSNTVAGELRLGDDSFGNQFFGYFVETGIWAPVFSSGQQSTMNLNQRGFWVF